MRSGALELAVAAHDASHYLLTPRGVITARSVEDVTAAMRLAGSDGIGLTFRSGGTSLSGQAGGAGVMVDVRRGFTDLTVLADQRLVRCGPGLTVRAVNAALARHGQMIGPDPASGIAATIGGVVANNSSGMACGTEFNTYATIAGLTLTLASGTTVDTTSPDAAAKLSALEPALCEGLARLADRVRSNPESRRQIAAQYSMKNTMGYGLNSLVDFTEPIDILTHLMVGSEGTLGFISSVTLRTLAIEPCAATALLLFASIEDAADSIEGLKQAGAKTVELMDPSSIRAAKSAAPDLDPMPQATKTTQTALLVEVRAEDQAALEERVRTLEIALSQLKLDAPAQFARDQQERDRLWSARNGLYTAVAGQRPPGTSSLIEDIAVPVPALSQTCAGLRELFNQHNFPDSVTFGHAKDGNLHFMMTLDLDQDDQLGDLDRFTDGLVDLVLGNHGTLKAEHGTGRIMAPFVRRQFGPELYDVMREIKRLFDEQGVLAPGVLIADDPRVHMRHIKAIPQVDPAFDRCVECGYCEPTCPARNLTLTPRGRIAAMRAIARLSPSARRAAERDFFYAALDTCAADSLCVIACPVGIDTGKLMKARRAARRNPVVQSAGEWVADHWGGTVDALRGALKVAQVLPAPVLPAITQAARTVLPKDWVPQAGRDLPGPGRRRAAKTPLAGTFGAPDGPIAAVYFATCVNSLFAPAPGGQGVVQALDRLSRAADVRLTMPSAIASLCCGTVWESKGLTKGLAAMAERTFDALWKASAGGELPVISDAASCTHGLAGLRNHLDDRRAARAAELRVIDATTFVRQQLMPRLRVDRKLAAAAVHPTCSTVHLRAKEDLIALAGEAAEDVFVPLTWGCCAFAGDRGMLHPELTAAATRPEAEAVWDAEAARARSARAAGEQADGRFDAYVSANRTCELGIGRATGRVYRHVLEVLAPLVRPL
ncbi:MAG: FAD-binding oxidoreductase [Bifidobacteriaceae bacterium]|nr:FAD-binding oxidoreductase [Bifidobacteriaceae bacterium]